MRKPYLSVYSSPMHVDQKPEAIPMSLNEQSGKGTVVVPGTEGSSVTRGNKRAHTAGPASHPCVLWLKDPGLLQDMLGNPTRVLVRRRQTEAEDSPQVVLQI